MNYWPDKTPRSTGNAFDLSLAKSSGFDTGAEKAKAKRLNVEVSTETCQAFEPIAGLSAKAQAALRVPKNRTTVALNGSACPSRIPDIPKAKRSGKAAADRLIRPEGLFPRATSNGSRRPGWIGT